MLHYETVTAMYLLDGITMEVIEGLTEVIKCATLKRDGVYRFKPHPMNIPKMYHHVTITRQHYAFSLGDHEIQTGNRVIATVGAKFFL